MSDLSWNVRLVLGMLLLAIIAVIGFGLYYTVVRLDRGKALEFEAYPGSQLINEETVAEGFDHFYYTTTDSPELVERFFANQDYVCRRQSADIYVDTVYTENIFVQSVCIVDRSHSLGFIQFNTITIQPQRTPWQDPPSAGGGGLTGIVIIDIKRQWGGGLFGG